MTGHELDPDARVCPGCETVESLDQTMKLCPDCHPAAGTDP